MSANLTTLAPEGTRFFGDNLRKVTALMPVSPKMREIEAEIDQEIGTLPFWPAGQEALLIRMLDYCVSSVSQRAFKRKG